MSRRTIFRDLDALRRVEVPLVFDEDKQTYCIPGQYFLPPTNFTPQEALAVLILCHELGADARLPFWRAARDAATKLELVLPEELIKDLREITPAFRINLTSVNPLDGQQSTYEQLVLAIQKRHPVGMQYHSTDDGRFSTRLDPYRLLFSQHSWYVIGKSLRHKEVRTFNVGRIESLEILPDKFEIPRNFSVDRYLGNAWRLIRDRSAPDYEVHLRFSQKVARNVREVKWHRTQELTENKDGSLDFYATVSGLEEIHWWILGYGDQVEVIAPKELRKKIVERVQSMAKLYGG